MGTTMVMLRQIRPGKFIAVIKILLVLFFFGPAWGADMLQKKAVLNPLPIVSFANWSGPLPFRTLDVQDQSALIEVEINPVSEKCDALKDCLPVYRIERRHLEGLILEGFNKEPTKLGQIVAARLAGNESFLFYRDHLVIADRTLNVLERVLYPESLKGRLEHGSPVIGVAPGGNFVFIDTFLWDRQSRHWYSDTRWKLISPELVMGDHRVMALGSYHSGEVWLIPYQKPQQSHRFEANKFQQLFLSPNEQSLLIEEQSGCHRLINTENQVEEQHWKQWIRYQQISWRNNRILAIEPNGNWTLHQIEPHLFITRGSLTQGGFSIISDQLSVCIFFNPEQNMANFIHLDDGHSLGQQKLPELRTSYAWLGQKVPLAYSRKPLTLLLDAGLTKRGIPQFRPYRLEMLGIK